MGNHYDPYDNAAEIEHIRDMGYTAQATIAAMTPYDLGSSLHGLDERFRRLEKHVIGGDAVDELRFLAREIRRITGAL